MMIDDDDDDLVSLLEVRRKSFFFSFCVWTLLLATWCGPWGVLCRAWTSVTSWIPSNSGYSVVLCFAFSGTVQTLFCGCADGVNYRM